MEWIEKPDGNVIVSDVLGKIIYQSPWFREGEFRGIIGFSHEIPVEMPHLIRG